MLAQESAGKVSIFGGSDTLTGNGTALTPQMDGSVVRLSATGIKPPSSLIMGTKPAAFEMFVTAYVPPTSLRLADPADEVYGSVAYLISDMVDIEPGAMIYAYLR